MDPGPNLRENSAELSVRQDRLERQLQELSLKLTSLEAHLASTPAPSRPAPPPPLPPAPRPVGYEPKPVRPNPARASLEDRIGSQLFNRVGIFALLIGATWFLKLAVDNGWIGPTARVLIGLFAGLGIVLWSERFRRSGFAAFSFSLKAIGSGVLYLSLWASFQLYHLLPASVALAAMLLVTAWNAYMAWAQDAELLAVYALAGGLATPLLLSTGGNHEIFLFTYLLALDLACVLLTRLKPWPRLLLGAFPATVAYFIGWYAHFYNPAELSVTVAFLLLFAAVFSLAVFDLRPHREPVLEGPHLVPQILLPIANAGFLSLGLYSVLQDSGHHEFVAWVLVALAALYLLLMRLPQPAITAAVHLSLAIVFLTVAIPLKASGHWITAAWLAEGLALLWISTRLPGAGADLRIQTVLRALSLGALTLGLCFTLGYLVEQQLSRTQDFFSSTFYTALLAIAVFAAAAWLAHPDRPQLDRHTRLSRANIAVLAAIAANLIAVLTGVVEISALRIYSSEPGDASLQRALAVSAFLMFYGALLLAAGFWRRSALTRWQALILLVVSIAKTFLYDMRNLRQGYRVLSFLGLGALLMAISFAYQKDWLALRASESTAQQDLSE